MIWSSSRNMLHFATSQRRGRKRVPLLYPSGSWDGTVSWSGRSAPTDPTRTTFKPVAHFAIPPRQDVTADLTIPVVAFCKGGIDSVTFWCEGNTVQVTDLQVISEYSGRDFEGYKCTLSTSSFPAIDGEMEVYATVTPSDGTAQSRVIGPLTLFGNVGDTLPTDVLYVDGTNGDDGTGDGSTGSPFATITKAKEELRTVYNLSGGTIRVRDGNYDYSASASLNDAVIDRWLTIMADDGHSPVITAYGTGTDGLRVSRIKLVGIDIDVSVSGDLVVLTGNSGQTNDSLWIQDVTYTGPGRLVDGSSYAKDFADLYAIDSTISECRDGAGGHTLCRNLTLDEIGSDALQQTKAIVSCYLAKISKVGTGGESYHPDVWQWNAGEVENVLMLGLKLGPLVDAQGIFCKDQPNPVRDMAAVNSMLWQYTGDGSNRLSQFDGVSGSHILFWHMTIEQVERFRDSDPAGVTFEYLDIRGCYFLDVDKVATANDGVNNNDWDYNAFVQVADEEGTNAVTITPEWDSNLVPTAAGNMQMGRGGFTLLDVEGNLRSATAAYYGAHEA